MKKMFGPPRKSWNDAPVLFYQHTDKYSYFPSKLEEGLIRLLPYDDPACWSIDQVALSLWLRHWIV